MKKTLFLILFLSGAALANSVIPVTPSKGLDKDFSLRAFYNWSKINWMLELNNTSRENEDNLKAYSLGAKYRVHKNLKLGATISRQFGNRHDDDWIKDGIWKWTDTSRRGETFSFIDIIPRTLLSFLPGERWVGEFRIRYARNFFNSQNTIKLRPRLTYFHFNEKGPLFNVFLQYEAYLPLNYGTKSIYEKWAYLGFLYHFNKWFKPGLFVAQKSLTWGSSGTATRLVPSKPYEVTHKANVVGFNMIFKIPD
ncbi:MAG: hypothetical protein ACJAT2_001171 [Bacteriovoracaceae bacterium]|jgi:hypothetical protein